MPQWVDMRTDTWRRDPFPPDPRVFLEPTETSKLSQSVFNKYFLQASSAMMGFFSCTLSNYFKGKPRYSGFAKHIVFTAGGYIFGEYLSRFVRRRQALRDAALRDYIRQHPEDFLIPEPIKYKDILQPWIPIR